MKKIAALLLALLLCGSLFACAQVQNVQDAFYRSAESQMIGRTFQEVEAAFGPFSMVFFEEERPAAYVFSKTNIVFHFDASKAQADWRPLLTNGIGLVPAAVALQSIQPTDVCIGVSGRIRDFGAVEQDVDEIAKYMKSLKPGSYETKANTVYTLTTTDQAFDVFLYCAHGELDVTADHYVRVMAAGTEAAAFPQVTEFSFGGTVIQVGETKVEVRGTKEARRTVTAQEFADLVTYCPDLQSLVLDYCDVWGEEQVGQLTELIYLELMSCNIPDASFVRNLKKLTHLGLCHNALLGISAIEDLPLTYLNLGDNPKLGNRGVRSAGKISSLRTLYLYETNISNLSALNSLRQLRYLNLNHNANVTESELAKLDRLTHLRKLYISSTGVTNLDVLTGTIPSLKELEARKLKKLAGNQSIFGLEAHPNLEKLTLSKDLKDSLDADAMTNYGMKTADWFKTKGVAVTFR